MVNKQENGGQNPVEQRNQAFWAQGYQELAQALPGMYIATADAAGAMDVVIEIGNTVPFTKDQNSKYPYKPIVEENMSAGTLYICEDKRFRTAYALAVGPEATCTQIKTARKQNAAKTAYEPLANQRSIGEALGLQLGEQVGLEFKDMDSNVLWVVKREKQPAEVEPTKPNGKRLTPEKAEKLIWEA